jgi:trehalose 6-phosphate phosphatase
VPAGDALPVPTTEAGADGLRAIASDPARALIGVDFDGTLAPIVAEPSQARAHPRAAATLMRLARQVGTVAIVTGRPSQVAASLLGFDSHEPPSNLLVVGHYGLESWTSSEGVVRLADVDVTAMQQVRLALPALLDEYGPAGTAVEDKGLAVVVHVRATADPDAALLALRSPLAALARTHGVRLEPGRMVLELRPPGTDKGLTLAALVRARGSRSVCYIGDDLGDVAAFDALAQLRADGLNAIAVCSSLPGAPPIRELVDRADLVLAGPGEVVAFFEAWLVAFATPA